MVDVQTVLQENIHQQVHLPVYKIKQMLQRIQSIERMVRWLYCRVKDGVSGGLQSIIAGDNINVDNTDPLNPIISSTGGEILDQENIIRIPSATYEELGLTALSSTKEKQIAIANALQDYENLPENVLLFKIEDEIQPEILNKFTWNNFNKVPTQAAFEVALGEPMINPKQEGNSWLFDNVGYSTRDYDFMNEPIGAGLIHVIMSASKLGSGSFQNTDLITFVSNTIYEIGYLCFQSIDSLIDVYLPKVTAINGSAFGECNRLTNLYTPICGKFADTHGSTTSFTGIVGGTITITVPKALQYINAGAMEGSFQWLASQSTVTFNWV